MVIFKYNVNRTNNVLVDPSHIAPSVRVPVAKITPKNLEVFHV